jgi:uncharacterized protein (DUF342 family)
MITDEKEDILLGLAKDECDEKRNEAICVLLEDGEKLTSDLNFKIISVQSEIRKLHRELEELLQNREQKLLENKLSRRNFGDSEGHPVDGHPLNPAISTINDEYRQKVRYILKSE